MFNIFLKKSAKRFFLKKTSGLNQQVDQNQNHWTQLGGGIWRMVEFSIQDRHRTGLCGRVNEMPEQISSKFTATRTSHKRADKPTLNQQTLRTC